MEPHGIRRIQFNCYKVKEADWVGGDNGVGNPSAKAMAELGKQSQSLSASGKVRLEAELFLPNSFVPMTVWKRFERSGLAPDWLIMHPKMMPSSRRNLFFPWVTAPSLTM